MAFRLPAGVSGPNAIGSGNVRADYYNPWVSEFIGNHIANPANPSDPGDYVALTDVGASTFFKSSAWIGDPAVPDGSLTPPPVIADIDFTNGAIDAALDPLIMAPATDGSGAPYYFSAPAPKLTAALNLTIDARVRASASPGYKYAAVVSNSYDLRVDQTRVMFSLWTAGGVTRLGANTPALKDLAAHDVSAAFDGVAGVMTISVDGVEVARRTAPNGPIAYYPTYKLYAGGAPWGGSIGGGLERLKISR